MKKDTVHRTLRANSFQFVEFVATKLIEGQVRLPWVSSGSTANSFTNPRPRIPNKTKALRSHSQKNAVTAQGRRKILPAADRVDRSPPADSLIALIPVVLLLNRPQPNGVDDDDGPGLRAQDLAKDLDQRLAEARDGLDDEREHALTLTPVLRFVRTFWLGLVIG